ncbi:MAG: three-Cys-motif partner protein TcmP [Candidatus Lokiarchaeota archaeon]|nr:three-Cys-motif partner protein TcmP [Candidatus Lokiarchaeota archaeon]
MNDLKFDEHTEEKLETINYYYKTWFGIVKRQQTNIIDAYAGTGYNEIRGKSTKRKPGSALLAVDLFRYDDLDNLNLIFINKDPQETDILRENITEYIRNSRIEPNVISRVTIYQKDWSKIIDTVIDETRDSIRLFLLDPYGAKSLPWVKVKKIAEEAKSKYGYKESGTEILINWAWHTLRRLLGKYYKSKRESTINHYTEVDNLDSFFGGDNWKNIADKYPDNIFSKEDKNPSDIRRLMEGLVFHYAKKLFEFFRYICIHPVYARIQTNHRDWKKRGEIVYYIIFASNYHDAPNIISTKFKEYITKKIYLPKTQKNLDKYLQSKKKRLNTHHQRVTINIKIRRMEEHLQKRLTNTQKRIIKSFYKRKNQDYGCYEFYLLNEIGFGKDDKEFQELMKDGIIATRQKEFRTSNGSGQYLYLKHKDLVNRQNFLFFNEKIYKFDTGELSEVE